MGKLVSIILNPILLCALYINIGNEEPIQPALPLIEEEYIQRYMACVFIALFCSIGLPLYDTVMIFPSEREVFFRESSSKLYNTYIYFLTRYLIEIPGIIIPPLITGVIVYLALALNNSTHATVIYCTYSFI
jgi:hypothetical protein